MAFRRTHNSRAALGMAAVSLVLAGTPVSASDRVIIDQEDPAYQRTMEHLAAARQALDAAQRELAHAEAHNVVAGFRIDEIHADITPIRENLSLYLEPRERELDYRRLSPDGVYFTPLDSGNDPLQ